MTEQQNPEEARLIKALADNGVSPVDQEWHRSWRCTDKDRYPGDCGCLPELLTDLSAILREAKAVAWFEGAQARATGLVIPNPYVPEGADPADFHPWRHDPRFRDEGTSHD